METKIFNPDFIIIPYKVIDSTQLEQTDLIIYGVIYWYEHLKDGECRASNTSIARIAHLNPRSVQNALTRLENGGFIRRTYKDSSKRHRLTIECLVSYKTERILEDTGKVERTTVRSRANFGGYPERIMDDQIKNSISNINNTTSEQDSREVVDIIDSFKEVNSNYRSWFRNTTQRGAIKDLLKYHGKDTLLKVIAVLPKSNKMPYIPTVTTPLQLRDKWNHLKASLEKEKSKLRNTRRVFL